MRKLFSILVVAMTAISLNATVVTKDFDMSQFSNYGTATVSGGSITDAAAWNGAQLWQWTEGVLEYDQVVLEVANHTEKILFRVQYSDATEVQKELPEGTNSMVIDIEQDIIKGIFVLNWSENSDIDITITGLYMRGAIGPKKTEPLWEGSKAFNDFDWDNRLLINAEDFADLHVGDILEVYYSTNAESYHQFDIKTNDDNKYPSFAPAQISLGGSNESGVLRFYIADATDLSNIASKGGLYFNGKFITFTKVSVIKHEVLWTGTTGAGSWSGYQEISSSKLSDLKVGNIICVRLSDLTIDGESQVALWYNNDSWKEFSPGVNYYFHGGDEAPMVVEFPVTYKMEQQLRGKNLLVRGKNFTMTDIYVKEGTPTNTVAGYLTVTPARMATLVLPFNVPSPLPDGVQAYNLTNNGDATIWAEEVFSLTADKPVLIVAPQGEHEFISEEGASDDISSKTGTFTNGALIGTYTTINPLAQQTGDAYNYILQNGSEGVGFYQVRDNSCYVDPYRAYLSCGYNPPTSVDAPARAMRIVFRENTATGVDNIESAKMDGSAKFLRNGQLFILRNGVEYNANGALVK